MDDELIPVLQVLEDMYEDRGIVSMAARDYYYMHYATSEQKKQMDREERIQCIVGGTLSILAFGILIVAVILGII